MASLVEKQTNWKDLQFPKTVFKYRNWKDKYHKLVLTNLEVFLSAPSDFEDPLDCKNQIRYDLLTDEEIFAKYLSLSKESNPTYSVAQHTEFASHWFKNTLIRDNDFILEQQQKDFLDYNNRVGILSLTANPANNAMWNKYSDNHSGFCVGFNSNTMFKSFGGGGEVVYCDELPIIKPFPWDSYMEQSIKQEHYKLKKWSFEEEYRTHLFRDLPLTNEQRKVVLPKEAYKEVILGALISKYDKEEIIAVCKETLPNIKFKQVIQNNNDDSISINPLD